MPESRPAWKGRIKFGRISLSVGLHAVHDSGARLGFRLIHVPTGQPIEMQRSVPGIGPVPDSEVGRGVEIAKDRYVVLTEEELAAISLESREVVDIDAFLVPDAIGAFYYDRAYYVLPDKGSEAAYRILRDAMRSARRIGVGRIAMRTGESIAVVRPRGKGIVLETIRYPNEIRSEETYFDDLALPATKGAGALAKDLVLRMTRGSFDLGAYSDRYRDEVMRLAMEKARTGSIKRRQRRAVHATPVESLLEALRKSMDLPPRG